jgi:hypothetical protein
MREVLQLKDLHDTERFVFCFDHSRKHLLRRVAYPKYKCSRDHDDCSELEKEMYAEANRQIRHLRNVILPGLGYRNVLCEKGFEADDLVASVVGNLSKKEEAIIVARDADYFQLLGPRCIIWNASKGKAITAQSFEQEYGITPSQWADVKAIAGCGSDDVEGIRGVGEKTAAAFLAGRLKPVSAKHILITLNHKIWKRNLPLVRLPYEGTPVFKLRKDKMDEKKWKRLCERLGFRSFLGGGRHGEEKAKEKKRKRSVKGFGIRA